MYGMRMVLVAGLAASLVLASCDQVGAPESSGGDSAVGDTAGTGGNVSPDTPVSSAPTTGTPPPADAGAGAGDHDRDACGASKVAAFVSRKATPGVRAEVAAKVGHSTIRWIGPDTMVTEDYSLQRLNVTLDADDVITGAHCG